MSPQIHHFLLLSLFLFSHFHLISPLDFIFNSNFNSTNLLTFGNSTIQSSSSSSSSILSLTNDTNFNVGRAFYPFKIRTKNPNSSTPLPFSTSFIFSMSPVKNFLPGHGFAFVFFPLAGVDGADPAQHLGLFNFTNDGNPNNHVLAVEFDTFMNQEFNDLNDNHVGINLNSLTSIAQESAGFWVNNEEKFQPLKLENGENYQVWIDYLDSRINITMVKAGDFRPIKPLISEFVNLSDVFLDEMYVGFVAATGMLVQSHRILSWSFSNTNFSISDALVTKNLPSFVDSKSDVLKSRGFIIGISVACVMIIVIGIVIYELLKRGKLKKKEELEDWELEYWPHRIDYEEIVMATKGFSEENVIGYGGNGKVYRGTLQGGSIEVAIKKIPHQNGNGTREFLAEISSLGRLKHRNLVPIRGWSKQDKQSLILLYDYMENGSLHNKLPSLNWDQRIKILKDVANGVLYLHEGWESKVIHRDIKSSNVLLDKNMTAKLGDFGLARVYTHGQVATTTQVVGTAGYMAPEVVRTGRASTETDVFSFGVLVLEVVCGRRPIEEGKLGLVDYVLGEIERDVIEVLDDKIRGKGGYDVEEVERMIKLGLLCVNFEGKCRPKMREVVKFLNEGNELEMEEMEANLLQDIRRSRMLFNRGYQSYGDSTSHPTFNELLPNQSSSISLFESDIIYDGR
ncbi:probable L-type lectin-domain containing receptor kinase VII.2 [Euphorbia lathyris]|uniref:probable L-type lectin-domain containing receptor kinase VII.2 n=1 Tax=Euphorbia lathyris TaxID=212925 RepID=UPI003313A74D